MTSATRPTPMQRALPEMLLIVAVKSAIAALTNEGKAMKTSTKQRILGCLLAGACGDALGAPFEFSSHTEMIIEGGPRGVRNFWTDGGRLGAVTDETQLVLFTTAALVNSRIDRSLNEVEHLHLAYLAWLSSQGVSSTLLDLHGNRYSALCDIVAQQGDRVPNGDTMEALGTSSRLGANGGGRKQGNGAVARVAPVGLLYSAEPQRAYRAAVANARLTHNHPRAYIAAGAFAMLVAWLTKGYDAPQAVERTLMFLRSQPDHEETSSAILNAPWKWSEYCTRPYWMGFGWSADEALAIAVNAVLTTATLEDAIAVAANHDGDSDTTASMAGNLAGALHGAQAIPQRWLEQVEMRRELEEAARTLCRYVPECSRSASNDQLHRGN